MVRIAVLICALALTNSAVASKKGRPVVAELLAWTACLKAAGLAPIGGRRSTEVLEAAFATCSSQEDELRQSISRDRPRSPEYNIEYMKNVLRAQQDEKTD